ncbi:hypothetical protein MB84_28215 (plasmid) [Pandoraea oxalativorans]|uniref:Uncharacterized protein n=2 Tax=Pandoraea oxalativorans TaxID=573737 RepID=A0A0G3IBQ4_9BURK|nr:hypothetical protein MB84_28215 [Pandoraea oxalativorans]
MVEFHSIKNRFLGSRPYEACADLVAKACAGELAAETSGEGAGVPSFKRAETPCSRPNMAVTTREALRGKSFKWGSGGVIRFAKRVHEFVSPEGMPLGSRPYAASGAIVAMASSGELEAAGMT